MDDPSKQGGLESGDWESIKASLHVDVYRTYRVRQSSFINVCRRPFALDWTPRLGGRRLTPATLVAFANPPSAKR